MIKEDLNKINSINLRIIRNKKVTKRSSDVFSCLKDTKEDTFIFTPKPIYSPEIPIKKVHKIDGKLKFLDNLYSTRRDKFTPKRLRRYVKLLRQVLREVPTDIIEEFNSVEAVRKVKKVKQLSNSRNSTRVPKKYEAYIKSKHWERRKNRYYQTFGRVCVKCGSTKHIHLHHIVYDNELFGSEPDVDLSPLCEKCHKLFHDTYGVKKNCRKEFTEFLKPQLLESPFTTLIPVYS